MRNSGAERGIRGGARRRLSLASALAILAYGCTAAPPPGEAADDVDTSAAASPDDPGKATLDLLFGDHPRLLSPREESDIVEALGFTMSEDRTQLVDSTCGLPITWSVRYLDLGADARPEVVVDYGNACTSGMAGTSVTIFTRSDDGGLDVALSLPGLIAEVRPRRDGLFSDLLIGGPGFCFGVWRWADGTYEHLQNEPQSPGGCDRTEP